MQRLVRRTGSAARPAAARPSVSSSSRDGRTPVLALTRAGFAATASWMRTPPPPTKRRPLHRTVTRSTSHGASRALFAAVSFETSKTEGSPVTRGTPRRGGTRSRAPALAAATLIAARCRHSIHCSPRGEQVEQDGTLATPTYKAAYSGLLKLFLTCCRSSVSPAAVLHWPPGHSRARPGARLRAARWSRAGRAAWCRALPAGQAHHGHR